MNLQNLKLQISSIKKNKNIINNEAATVNSLIRPFFEKLGWDFSNIEEVTPEDTDNNGQRPDFTMKINGKIKLLIEAKPLGNDLSDVKMINKKVSYCANSDAKFLIITNGEIYKIYYSELKGKPKDKLLNEFSILNEEEPEIIEKLSKKAFENDELLKYSQNIFILNNVKKALEQIFSNPPPDFIKTISATLQNVIGHSFGEKEIKESLRNFILDISSSFENQTMEIENDNADEQNTVKSHFKNGTWKNTYELYKLLIEKMKKENLSFSEKPTKKYIGFVNNKKKNKNFLQICGQKSKLKVWLCLTMSDLTETEKSKVRDVSKIGHHGMGNIEISIKNIAEFDVVLPLIKKSYYK